jgi:hypothetical protein
MMVRVLECRVPFGSSGLKKPMYPKTKQSNKTAVSLFRERVHCNSSAADPNVWGFGWNAQGSEIYLLVQPTANDPCGRPDQFISLVVRSPDGKILETLSKKQTKAKFRSRLPSSLFGK